MRKEIRPEMNKKYNTIAMYTLCVALIIACFILGIVYSRQISSVLGGFLDVLSPIMYGFVFAYVLCPVCNFFDRYLNKLHGDKKIHKYFLNPISKRGGLIITYVLFVSALVGFFYIVIPQITSSFNSFYDNYKIYINRADVFLKDLGEELKFIPEETYKNMEQGLVSLLERVVETITEYSPILINKVSGLAVGIWNIILGIVISIYMLAEKKYFMRVGRKLVYSIFSARNAQRVCAGIKKTHEVFGGFINGKLLDSLIIGIICFIGTTILRMPYAPLISLIVGITNIIPYFGPFMGAIPSIIIVFLNEPVKAFWFALFVLGLQQLDGNFIGPKILGQRIGISSFWIITSLIVMGGLYGLAGMILAVPLFALLNILLSRICNGVLMRRGISVTNDGVNIMEIEDPFEFEDAEPFDGEYAMQEYEGYEIYGKHNKE